MKQKRAFLAITSGAVMMCLATSAEAFTITVKGKVVDQSNQPIPGAYVFVLLDVANGLVPHNTLVAVTDANGLYQGQLTIHEYASAVLRAFPARLTAPIYRPQSKGISKPFVDGEVVTFDFALQHLPNGAVVAGTLTDDQTGLPVGATGVSSQSPGAGQQNPYPLSISNGFYVLVFDVTGGPVTPLTLMVDGANSGTGIRYVNAQRTIRISPGESQTVNVPLKQAPSKAAYLYGRVSNGATGEPIPYAVVTFLCTACSFNPRHAITDQFGGYKMDTNHPFVTGSSGSTPFNVTTAGAPSGAYTPQQVIVNPIPLGTTQELNFDMF